jgi:biopolymer transport protein ExbD
MHFGPNMTPMVDVVIVILIFFMSATAFMGPEWFLRAHIPATAGPAGEGEDAFDLPAAQLRIELVRLASETRATGLGLQDATLDELDQALAALGETIGQGDAVVILDPDPRVPYRDVVLVRDLCERAGIPDVGLSTR